MNLDRDGREKASNGDLVISSRFVALSGVFLGSVLLIALAIVSFANHADALSVVAIVVGLLAFLIQILVFHHQAVTFSRLTERVEEINSETLVRLVELEMLIGQSKIREREQLDPSAKPIRSVRQTPFNYQTFSDSGSRDVGTGAPPAHLSLVRFDEGAKAYARSRSKELFSRFPEAGVGLPFLQVLRSLSEEARQRLRKLAEDEIRVTAEGTPENRGKPVASIDVSLQTFELTQVVEIKLGDRVLDVSRLTERGRTAACLLLAEGDPPEYASEFLAEVTVSGGSG